MKPIVVGVDGSATAREAVRWAAIEARLRHRPLQIVHCWLLIDTLGNPAISGSEVSSGWQQRAEAIVRSALDAAHAAAPDASVTSAVRSQLPTWGLLSAAADAEMLVLGARGLGTFEQLLLGSTSREVAAKASCPVVVVRGSDVLHHRVVVGVDGSAASREALDFAFAEASWRNAVLVTVHACGLPHELPDLSPSLREHLHAVDAGDRVTVQETLAGFGEMYPDVKVDEVFLHGEPVPALVTESTRADLVVVGSRGRSATTGLLLGSVAHALLRHAESPVAVIHPTTNRN